MSSLKTYWGRFNQYCSFMRGFHIVELQRSKYWWFHNPSPVQAELEGCLDYLSGCKYLSPPGRWDAWQLGWHCRLYLRCGVTLWNRDEHGLCIYIYIHTHISGLVQTTFFAILWKAAKPLQRNTFCTICGKHQYDTRLWPDQPSCGVVCLWFWSPPRYIYINKWNLVAARNPFRRGFRTGLGFELSAYSATRCAINSKLEIPGIPWHP